MLHVFILIIHDLDQTRLDNHLGAFVARKQCHVDPTSGETGVRACRCRYRFRYRYMCGCVNVGVDDLGVGVDDLGVGVA